MIYSVTDSLHLQQAAATPMMGGYTPMSPRLSSPMHPSQGGGGATPGRGRGRGADRRDKGLIGQTVRIIHGPYKGRSPGKVGNMYIIVISSVVLETGMKPHSSVVGETENRK